MEAPPPSPGDATPRWRDFEHRLDYSALRHLAGIYARAFHRLHVHTPCPIPRRGPALIAANHTAGLDPVMVQATCPRPIAWIMTRDFYDRRGLRWFFEWTQMIRIDQEGRDAGAWRAAMRHLKAGHVVGVFPEGRIEREGKLLPFQTGIALLARRGAADIYPVYLDGPQRNVPMFQTFVHAQHPSIAWGAPLRVGRGNLARRDLGQLTRHLEQRVEKLREYLPAPRKRGRSMLAPR